MTWDATVADSDEKQILERQIRHARETAALLERLRSDPTPQDVIAFHELHARHLRELGDEDAAARADERADRARRRSSAQDSSSSTGTVVRTSSDIRPKPMGEDVLDPSDEKNVAEGRAREAPGNYAERASADSAMQVEHARARSQRAGAALQRTREGSDRAEAYAAREQSGTERSDAARRRLHATAARAAASALRCPPGEREGIATERDTADGRERLADEREQLGDERDRRADRRDRIADRRDRTANEREKAADMRDARADDREFVADALNRWAGLGDTIANELERADGLERIADERQSPPATGR